MIRFAHLVTASCALAALLGTARMAVADTIDITKETEGYYKEYLQQVPVTAASAFAVSKDGAWSYWDYCDGCALGWVASEVKSECERYAKAECTLLDTNRALKLDYNVADAPSDDAGAAQPPSGTSQNAAANKPATTIPGDTSDTAPATATDRQAILTADQFKKLIVGNTMTGVYTNGVKWEEYYDPNGEIRGFDEKQGTYFGKYQLRAGNMVCYDYPGTQYDWCAKISLQGDSVNYVLPSGSLDATSHDDKVVKGNPEKL